MKNRHVESQKQKAKLSHRNSRFRRFENGIIVHHVYGEDRKNKPSWWDDVGFRINDYLVNVAWRHPRFSYQEQVNDLAYEACAHLQADATVDLLDALLPSIVQVGNKKLIAYEWDNEFDPTYFDAVKAAEVRISRDAGNGVMILPSMDVEWTDWSKFVSICAPIEVRNVADLRSLAELTKRLLKRETTLAKEFPGAGYRQKDWVAEFPEIDPSGLNSHALNL